jgi:hypothetical protein
MEEDQFYLEVEPIDAPPVMLKAGYGFLAEGAPAGQVLQPHQIPVIQKWTLSNGAPVRCTFVWGDVVTTDDVQNVIGSLEAKGWNRYNWRVQRRGGVVLRRVCCRDIHDSRVGAIQAYRLRLEREIAYRNTQIARAERLRARIERRMERHLHIYGEP